MRSKAHTRQRAAAIRQIDRGLARVLKGAGERGGGKTRGRKNVSEIYRCSKACGRGWLLVLKLSRAVPRGGCPINQWGFFFFATLMERIEDNEDQSLVMSITAVVLLLFFFVDVRKKILVGVKVPPRELSDSWDRS
jgi:hypothetical protein